jgi:ABC-2 type transport system permease protein
MKAFSALIRREFLEHRGAFLVGPLLLVAVLLGSTILAFTVGRIDARFSGALFTAAPMRIYEWGFLGFAFAWSLYLVATLFFYCADSFAADKRNNAMLFWKSMPVSDFTVLLSKLGAALTIFPATIFVIALLSGALLFGVAVSTSALNGGGGFALLGNVAGVYAQVAASLLLVLALGLLWYLPFMAFVGALATLVGRWAIPLSLLFPALLSTLEWVVLGGGWQPLSTRTWEYLQYRADFPLTQGYVEAWSTTAAPFSFAAFATDLLTRISWVQIAIGAVFAVVVVYLASQYRRRNNRD